MKRGLCPELIREIKVSMIRETSPSIKTDSPEAIARFWRRTIASAPWFDPMKEHAVSLLLDARYRLTAYNLVSIGGLNESIAHPREIFRPAIVACAYAFVFAHNHPSGDPRPSRADACLTRRLHESAAILGVKFLDHVIVGNRPEYFSFREFRESHPRLARKLMGKLSLEALL